MKILRCYCNDDILCPLNKYKEQYLEITNNNNYGQNDILRHCSTNTVCLTKRLRRSNGTTWLKYFCDQSSAQSIRGKDFRAFSEWKRGHCDACYDDC